MKYITALFAFFIFLLWVLVLPTSTHSQERLPSLEVYFSPNGRCTDAIVREINKAKNTVLVQAYSFTSAPIAKALQKTENCIKRNMRSPPLRSGLYLPISPRRIFTQNPFH